MKDWIHPDWPAPPGVRAFTTTRGGGVSRPPFDSLNLGMHTGDDPAAVARNRALLESVLPSEPGWIRQIHGTAVVRREGLEPGTEADALVCAERGLACTVLTADCLPVLLCDRLGSRVAAVHAGWRGLAAGVIEAAVEAMDVEPERLLAWLGPGIGGRAYAVGADLQASVLGRYPAAAHAFHDRGGQLYADLYAIARTALAALGVTAITGGGFCTYTEVERFFSHRRDGRTGRMATAIWLA